MTPPRWLALGQLLRDLPRLLLLLAPLPVLLALLAYAVTVLVVAMDTDSLRRSLRLAAGDPPAILQAALAVAGAWYLLAALLHRPLLEAATGAIPVTMPEQAPRLWLMAAELAVRADMPMPRLALIEAPSCNLLAWQLGFGRGGIAVTTGMLEALEERELSAALAVGLCRIADGSARLALVGGLLAAPLVLATHAPWRIAGELWREEPAQKPIPAIRRRGRRPAARPRGPARRRGAAPPRLGARGGGNLPALVMLSPLLGAGALARLFAWPLRHSVPLRRLLRADAAAAALVRDAPALAAALRCAAQQPGPGDIADALRPLFLLDPVEAGGLLPSRPALPARLSALRRAGARPAAVYPAGPRPAPGRDRTEAGRPAGWGSRVTGETAGRKR